MDELKQRIKKLETDLKDNDFSLHKQYSLFQKYMSNPVYLSVGILISFGCGYMFSRKKNKKQIMHIFKKVSFLVMKTIRNLKFLSSLI